MWAKDGVLTLGETITMIPNRFKEWNPNEFISESNTYFKPYDSSKSVALEIIDPSCKFCAKLFGNIKETSFADRYNLTYLVYPIPDNKQSNGYRFPHSKLVASYLEAVKRYPLPPSVAPADWQILERMFSGKDIDNVDYQIKFNTIYTAKEAEDIILLWLKDIGYLDEDRNKIQQTANSDEARSSLSFKKKS